MWWIFLLSSLKWQRTKLLHLDYGLTPLSTHALRGNRTVWFVFAAQTLLFLVRNWHCNCWSQKAFPRQQMTPQSREKTAKTAVFRHRWQAWKVVRLIRAVHQRPRTPRNLRCSFAFFECFLWHFNIKQLQEVIFRLSRPVSSRIRKMAQVSNDLSTLPLSSSSNKSMGENLAENFSCKINVGKKMAIEVAQLLWYFKLNNSCSLNFEIQHTSSELVKSSLHGTTIEF